MARLHDKYKREVIPALTKHFGYKNFYQVPAVTKVVVNMGVGKDAIADNKFMNAAFEDLMSIVGQRPSIRRAKKSISNFKLREGMPIGVAVTLRRAHMYEFLDRLMNVAIPRIRDFRGVSNSAFDGRGNYTLGMNEHIVFPEIDYDKVAKIRGMDITIVTTAKTDEEGFELLTAMGMPFRKK
ncbi:MAG: 50S ribosomal protein L5 [bacterium]